MSDDTKPLRWYRVSCATSPGRLIRVECQGEGPSEAIEAARALLMKVEDRGVDDVVDVEGVSASASAHLSAAEIDVSPIWDRYGIAVSSVELSTVGPLLVFDRAPASEWPDQAEADRWVRAVESIAAMELQDRGVDKVTSVTCEYGALWANYGGLRVRVGGQGADIRDEAELFDYVDQWIAFELVDDESLLLDRDRAFIERWRTRLPDEKRIWEQAAAVVWADVGPTVESFQSWSVVLVEDVVDHPGRRDLDDEMVTSRSSMVMAFPPPGWQAPEPKRRSLLLPHLALRTDSASTPLFVGTATSIGTVEAAIEYIARWLQEEIIEDTRRAWPKCPRHEHPLDLEVTTWTCPADDTPIATVGHLRDPR